MKTISILLLIFVVLFGVGTYIDIRNFDRTEGGYEPPYEGWTGEPITWEDLELSEEGFYRPGLVVDFYLDCTTGMIDLRILKTFTVGFRKISERGILVHKPRPACEERGFKPEF